MGRFGIADAVLNLYTELLSTMTMLEVAEECQNGIVCTPILKPDDVLVNPHFEARAASTMSRPMAHDDAGVRFLRDRWRTCRSGRPAPRNR